eukprot:jgi/Psemu1/6896/gm1.6896_g
MQLFCRKRLPVLVHRVRNARCDRGRHNRNNNSSNNNSSSSSNNNNSRIFKHETIPTTTYYDDNNEEEPGGAQQQQQQQQQECSYYETVLDFGGAPNAALLASQLCAVLAPGLAALAIIVSTVELLCRRFLGSFVLASVLFLTASTVQSGTFGILLIDPDLCLDHIHDDHDGIGCSVGKAAYIGASATRAPCRGCNNLLRSIRESAGNSKFCHVNDHHRSPIYKSDKRY